jgi:hypothetical protein
MEVRGGSRDGAVNRTLNGPPILDEIPIMDDIPIIAIQSATASMVSPVTSRSPPSEPTSPPPNGHRRGKSESQNLLPPSPKTLFEYSTRDFRYNQPDESEQDGRISPNWGGVAGSLIKTTNQMWRDALVDILAISAGLPFFALAGAIIRLDGKPVNGYQENILNQCIKGVSTKFSIRQYLLMF